MSQQSKLRMDHMVTQYVWALENEQAFMTKARYEAERSNFGQFRRLVGSYILPTRNLLGDNGDPEFLSGAEWSYLYMEMWYRLRWGDEQRARSVSYPNMNKSDCDDFNFHLNRLVETGYMLTGRGVAPRYEGSKPDPRADIGIGKPLNPIEPIQENKMSNQITIVNKTLINGVDVTTLSDEQLIDAIKKVEKEIEELKAVKTKSKKIAAKIEDANKTLTTLVELLDGR